MSLSDEDLDRIMRDQADPNVADRWPVEYVTALVAEVRRLREAEFFRENQIVIANVGGKPGAPRRVSVMNFDGERIMPNDADNAAFLAAAREIVDAERGTHG